MPDSDQVPSSADSSQPPDAARPVKGSSTAVIVRESDRMRTGTDAAVLDISMSTLLLSTRGIFAVEEQLKIRLRNVVQRFEKEARGVVRKCESNADGSTTVTVELLTRLSALEVSLLKMGIASGQAGSASRWV
jgi:DNA phosphorothioation-dependent restriction protein DptG